MNVYLKNEKENNRSEFTYNIANQRYEDKKIYLKKQRRKYLKKQKGNII